MGCAVLARRGIFFDQTSIRQNLACVEIKLTRHQKFTYVSGYRSLTVAAPIGAACSIRAATVRERLPEMRTHAC